MSQQLPEIPVIEATASVMPTVQEWFIPLVDTEGSGHYWSAGTPEKTAEQAQQHIRQYCAEVKQARIVRVVLPCREIK